MTKQEYHDIRDNTLTQLEPIADTDSTELWQKEAKQVYELLQRQKLMQFFNERPALSQEGLLSESSVKAKGRTVFDILQNGKNVKQWEYDEIIKCMGRYGY